MDREAMLQAIEQAYDARIKGDVATMAQHFHPEARFEIMGEKELLQRLPAGPGTATKVISSLIELITFHEMERQETVVEGNRAALLWRIRLSVGGLDAFDTPVFDIWEFGPCGRAVALRQSIDTARFAVELAKLT